MWRRCRRCWQASDGGSTEACEATGRPCRVRRPLSDLQSKDNFTKGQRMNTTTNPVAEDLGPAGTQRHTKANALADRLERGARELVEFAAGLTDVQWQTRVPH